MRIAWEHDHKVHSANAGLAMNFSTDVIQEVTELNLEIHGGAGCTVARHAEKLVRDALHLEPSRRRHRAAPQGRRAARADGCSTDASLIVERRHILGVTPGLDPGAHDASQCALTPHGLPGQARQ